MRILPFDETDLVDDAPQFTFKQYDPKIEPPEDDFSETEIELTLWAIIIFGMIGATLLIIAETVAKTGTLYGVPLHY